MSEIILSKMKSEYRDGKDVLYYLDTPSGFLNLNQHIGHDITFSFQGNVFCTSCGKKARKSFNQGYCYPCFRSLACCDICVIKPELCHYSKGTCREPAWGEAHCLIPHTVYLSNSSGLKVGITRGKQPITRWIDQGANEAITIGFAESRLAAGKAEVLLKQRFKDKTNWRKMLSGSGETVDLLQEKQEALNILGDSQTMEPVVMEPIRIRYPIHRFPEKIKSHNFDKTPTITGRLDGIKGQYLILTTGVLNIRKFGGYSVSFSSTLD